MKKERLEKEQVLGKPSEENKL